MPRKFFSRLSRIFDTQPSGKEKQASLETGLSNYIENKLNTGNIKLADKDIKFGEKSFEDIQYLNNRETTVCVVGAGFAGLAAAYELTQLKFKVTVLEARDRVGGRVLTQKTIGRGRFIEAGAELIGTTHYQWIYYARLFGLGLSVMTTEDNYAAEKLDFVCIINNEEIKDKELEEINDLSNQVFKRISKDAEGIDPYEPWKSKDAEKLDAISVEEKVAQICREICQDKPDLLKKLLTSINFHFVNDQATPISQQSYLGLLASVQGSNSYKDNINLDNGHESEEQGNMNYWDGSETFRCANGNQSLADEFRERIQKEGGEIRLGTEVTKIDIDKDETQNQITQKKVTITTSDGKSEKYDYVVFAVPPGVWESIEINPAIPELMKIEPGLAVKRFTSFKQRYWLAENKSPAAISDSLGMVWESTDNQMATPDSEFVLTVFAGGNYVEKVKDEENFIKSIKQLFPKTFEGFEGKSELVDWGAEKYTKCGYTCPRVNKIETTKLLNLPYYGHMFFAGEHTNTAFSGYMEGALRSGVFAAKRIAEAQLCRRSQAIGNDDGIYRGETPSRFEGNLIASVDPNKSQPNKIQLFDGLIKVLDGVDSIKKIVIRHGDIIDGIEIYYTNTETPDIQFGSTQKCRKNNFEWIVKDNNHFDGIRVKKGKWFKGDHIVQLQLKTKTEGWLPICGSGNYCEDIDSEFTTFVADEDEELISFYGASVPVDYPTAQPEIYPVISYLGAIFRKRNQDLNQ